MAKKPRRLVSLTSATDAAELPAISGEKKNAFYITLGTFFLQIAQVPSGPGPTHYRGFTITLGHTTLGRTPLDERSTRRRDLYLTTHNTHKRETSMPPAGFETAIPASKRPQTHVLDRAATGIGLRIRTIRKTVLENLKVKYMV
jgi:hypothetical protein